MGVSCGLVESLLSQGELSSAGHFQGLDSSVVVQKDNGVSTG